MSTVSHNKAVDSPMMHRELRKVNHDAPSVQRAQEGLEGTFRVGESHEHVEPEWKASQRYACKKHDTQGMLCYKSEAGKPAKKKLLDTSGNSDWTGDTGSSIQKVLDEKQSPVRNRGDKWAQSSCSKTIENSSPHRNLVIERGPVLIPNERVKKDPHHYVSGWNTESMKTVEQPVKKELNLVGLAKPVPCDPPVKPVVRPEDWDSNLKTLPNCAKGVERNPHVYENIKDSVVTQPKKAPTYY